MKGSILQYLTPPKKERLPITIADQLKKLILSKKLVCNEKLPSERELADILKVSRVVISQALMSLEQSGHVSIKRGSKGGAFIANCKHKPVSGFINDLFIEGELSTKHFREARMGVECFTIRLAVNKITKKDIERLKIINKKLWDDKNDPLVFGDNNMSFHVAIAEISGNPLFKGIIQSLLDHHRKFWESYYPEVEMSQDFIKRTFSRHEDIISALEKRDPVLCEKAMGIDVGFHKELDR